MPNSSTKARSVSDLLAAATAPAPSTRKPRAKQARQPRIPKSAVSAPPLVTPLPGERVDARTKASAPAGGVTAQIIVPKPYPWQLQVQAAMQTHRFTVVASARQIGKTEWAVLMSIDTAMKGGDVWWIAPTNRLANAGYDKMHRMMQSPPFKSFVIEYKQRRQFTFTNGGRTGTIEFISADDPTSVVSATLDLVVVDEAARMHPDAWYEGAYSTLSVRKGKALLITNPRGKNWYWELWQKGDPTSPSYDPEYCSFVFSQFDNPSLDPVWIKAQEKTMPRLVYEREVLGMFTDDGGDVFVGVRAAAYDAPEYPEREAGHVYVGGIDWGSRQDYTVITVYDATEHKQVAVHAYTGLLWEAQWAKIEQIQAFWQVSGFDAEENAAGSVNIEMLRQRGLPIRAFNTNWKTKRELIESWAAAIELKQTRILRDPEMIKQHESMERSEESDYGTVRFYAPEGQHDDYVISAALAYRAATVHDAAQANGGVAFLRTSGLYGHSTSKRAYPSWGRTQRNDEPRRRL